MISGISFIVASNNNEILEKNFLASGIFIDNHPHQILIQKGFNSAAVAYNDGIEKSKHNIMVFAHQDMYFPKNWDSILLKEIELIEKHDSSWGVIGCYGIDSDGNDLGYVYCNGQKKILGRKDTPQKIRILDEIVLIFKKTSELKFDHLLPGFHLYGTDICLQSENNYYSNYVISNLALHNTERILFLPPDFMKAIEYIRKTHKKTLPILTPCFNIYHSKITNILEKYKMDIGVYRRGMQKIKSERITNPELFYKTNLEKNK